MLKISKAQTTAMGAPQLAAFVERMRPLLRERYPEQTALIPEDDLVSIIEHGMQSSRRYGIKTVAGVERFLDFMFLLGFDFETRVGWAREILNRPDFTGQMRIELLCAKYEGRVPERPEDGPFFP